ncbi:MAG: alkaline phosphatase family protein [Deinococcales bacterium]
MSVIYISTDGMRPDALAAAETPNFHKVMAQGSYTLKAQSVMPSITLPCHMSTFHSIPPERHGILTNSYTPMVRPVKGLIDLLNDAGKRSATFLSWEPLRDLNRPSSLSHSSFIAYQHNPYTSDGRVVDAALRYMPEDNFDFSFVYLGAMDEVGHDYGWMSQRYLEQVEHSDMLLGKILEILSPDSTLIIHSDHGGAGRNHGTNSPEDMTIPWMIMGPNIKINHQLESPVSLLDTAPTIAHIFGLKPPLAWEGQVVREAFI